MPINDLNSLIALVKPFSLFIFIYPLSMSIVWSVSASFFAIRREGKNRKVMTSDKRPMVSIILPFFNEQMLIKDTIESLLNLSYPNFEIILVNDGSTDKSLGIVKKYLQHNQNVRLIDKSFNEGKAASVNKGIIASNGQILLFVDADAIVDKDILKWIIPHFTNYPRVGAVTGHPIVRNRSSLISRIQVVEYSSIISLIKRAQRIEGKIFTVSGVIHAVRKSALTEIGLYDPEMATEDIDISWRLQKQHFDIRFEPRALSWITVPRTLRNLYRQRLRWAFGGLQVLFKHFDILYSWKNRRMWLMFLENAVAIFWAFSFYSLSALWLLGVFTKTDFGFSPLIQWYGSVLALLSIIQMLVSALLNHKYDNTIVKNFFWAAWYPVYYWFISSSAILAAFFLFLFKPHSKKVSWQTRRDGKAS